MNVEQKMDRVWFSIRWWWIISELLPPSKDIWNNAPGVSSDQHASKDDASYQALFLRRKIPKRLDGWSNKREKHHFHGFRNPTHASVHKYEDLEVSKTQCSECIVNGVGLPIIFHLYRKKKCASETDLSNYQSRNNILTVYIAWAILNDLSTFVQQTMFRLWFKIQSFALGFWLINK